MKNIVRNLFLILILLFTITNAQSITEKQNWSADELEVKEKVEQFLFAAGNYNLDAFREMISDKASVGIVSLKDGERVSSVITIGEYYQGVNERKLRPYYEPVKGYTIHVTDGHLAFVKADATLYAFGVPLSHNMDYFTLIKENRAWKFINLSYSATPVSKNEKKFDLDIFAKNYAQAWCSQRPDFVASFYTEKGSLNVNNGTPAVGREEISKVAQSYMTAFPDIIVSLDSLVKTSEGIEFHWTFTGTNTGPDGTGKKVRVHGFELWQLENGLIKESKGSYDSKEYKRQLIYGVDN